MNIDKKALIGIIVEIEASRERAKGETRHQSEILKKAKEKNFDTKAIRKVLQRRAMSNADRDSLDLAVDSYERAMGVLASATEAVDEGRMSAREAAEHFGVPRGALSTTARGPKTGFSSQPPPRDTERGEAHETSPVAGSADGPSRVEAAQREPDGVRGRDGADSGEAGPSPDAGPGVERQGTGGGSPPQDANAVRVAPTVEMGAERALASEPQPTISDEQAMSAMEDSFHRLQIMKFEKGIGL